MVTILPPKPPSFGQSLLLGAAQAAPQAIENYYAKLAKQNQEQQAQETIKKYYGLETAGFDPEMRRAALVESMKQGTARADTAAKLKMGEAQVNQIAQERGIDPETAKSFASNPNLFERTTRPKAKTQAAQPIDPDQLRRIQEVRSSPEFKNMDESEQYDAMIDNGVSAENAEKQAKLRGQQLSRVQDIHKETQKYDEELTNNAKIAKGQIVAIDELGKALKSGNIKPSNWSNIFKGFGQIGDKISEALLNKDEATLLGTIPHLLEGWKQVFGVRLSDADLNLLQDKLPSIGKSAEANEAVVGIMRKYADMTLLRNKIASELKKENKGLRQLGYIQEIEDRFDRMTSPIQVISPATGLPITIPAYRLQEALKAGATLPKEEENGL